MILAILSDIHANYTALSAVLDNLDATGGYDAVAVLGDLINYGPRPNEVVERIRALEDRIIINLWGNHELSLTGECMDRFATERGRRVPEYTRRLLTGDNMDYISTRMNRCGRQTLTIDGRRFLFVHGTLDDCFWGKMTLDELAKPDYGQFDYVLAGHSHVPMYLEHFLPADNPAYRNKRRTVFINPGSVGQPRNHNPLAQYGLLDTLTGEYAHKCVSYDIEAEQRLYDTKSIDIFYKQRLKNGI